MTIADWIAELGCVSVSPLGSPVFLAQVVAAATAADVECVVLPTIGARTAWSVAPAGSGVVATQPNRLGLVETIPAAEAVLVEPDVELLPLLRRGGRSFLWVEGEVVSEVSTAIDLAKAEQAVAAGDWLVRRARQLRGFTSPLSEPSVRRCPLLADHDPAPYVELLAAVGMPAELVDVPGIPGCLVLAPSWRHDPSDLATALAVLAGESVSSRAEVRRGWGRIQVPPIDIP